MIIGKVIGSVVATRKNDNLIGNKFLVVEPAEKFRTNNSNIVAIDNVFQTLLLMRQLLESWILELDGSNDVWQQQN